MSLYVKSMTFCYDLPKYDWADWTDDICDIILTCGVDKTIKHCYY